MSDWFISWGAGSDGAHPPVPYETWAPRPVPSGAVRVTKVVTHGFGLPEEPLVVAWDDQRATVRSAQGGLHWYTDETHNAFPRAGEIVVEDRYEPFPRGNRYMSALVVRSLEDLIETVNAEEVTSIDDDGTIHIYGAHDESRGSLIRSEDTGIVLRASGTQGTAPWDLEVSETHLVEDDCGLLDPNDATQPLPF